MHALVMIVDDQADVVAMLELGLSLEGYATRSAFTGEMALAGALEHPLPNLILLDLTLPDLDGLEVCRRLKQEPLTRQVPIIMLTGRVDEIDRLVGLELGAEDYVAKPFSMPELMLRIRAVLRRTQRSTASDEEHFFGDLYLNANSHRAWVRGHEVALTALEFKLLLTLLTRRGRVQTREQLFEDVWGQSAELSSRTVDTHITRLRQKLGSAQGYIETIRGVGYQFCESPRSTDESHTT